MPPAPALYYDTECPLCTRSARLIRRLDRRGTLRYVSLQGPDGRALVEAHPALRTVDSVIWCEPAGPDGVPLPLVHSDAVLAVAAYLGGIWAVFGVLARLVPRPARDRVYRWVARHRPRAEHCAL